MKLYCLTFLFLFLGTCNAGWYHYWCANSAKDCKRGKSRYPTYKCGKQVGYDYYEIEVKKWWENGKANNDIFWNQYIDCCIDAGKVGCYQKWN